jgi:hypothetical protein
LAILPTDATDFTDPDVYPAGEVFTYSIRPLFVPFQDLRQDVPATTAQSCTNFRRPTPPFNLRVDTTGRQPKLSWDTADDKSAYAFIVYRGQTPTDLTPIGAPAKEPQFVDSTKTLSSRVVYYYAVQAMNLKQDTSELSGYVTYRPKSRAIVDFSSPQLIQSDIINNDAVLTWPPPQRRLHPGVRSATQTPNRPRFAVPNGTRGGTQAAKLYRYYVCAGGGLHIPRGFGRVIG